MTDTFMAPRESVAERLKVMSRTPGATIDISGDDVLVVSGDEDAVATVLRRAQHAAAIMGKVLGYVQGRHLVLRLHDADPSEASRPATGGSLTEHHWTREACTCGSETVICQQCGNPVCGEICTWVPKIGNVEPACLRFYGLGHAGMPS